jgi:hypothetical protein
VRIWVQAGLGKKLDPISKIARVKRVGGMTQAVEYLPSNHKALSSNFSTTKKKKRKKERKEKRNINTSGENILQQDGHQV